MQENHIPISWIHSSVIVFLLFLFISTWTFYRLAWRYNRNGFPYSLLGFSFFVLMFLISIASMSAFIQIVNPGVFGGFFPAFGNILKEYFLIASLTQQLLVLIPGAVICSIVYLILYLQFRKQEDSAEASKNLLDRLPK